MLVPFLAPQSNKDQTGEHSSNKGDAKVDEDAFGNLTDRNINNSAFKIEYYIRYKVVVLFCILSLVPVYKIKNHLNMELK